MTREQLIAKAATEHFTDGAMALDTAVALMGEGFDVQSVHDELQSEIDEALTKE